MCRRANLKEEFAKKRAIVMDIYQSWNISSISEVCPPCTPFPINVLFLTSRRMYCHSLLQLSVEAH